MFSRFHRIPVCDRQTDRRTDRETDGQTERQTDRHLATAYFALCIASRGKMTTNRPIQVIT